MKSYEEYQEEINMYVDHFNALQQLYKKVHCVHQDMNRKLEYIFDKAEKNKGITIQEAEEYLQIRSENDEINSELKLLSTSTNAMWIRIQDTYASLILHHANDIIINFKNVDRINGRLIFSIKRKDKNENKL